MKELIVALDLELNQPSERIIQIGAVIGNVITGEVLSKFDCKVNPEEPLKEEISALTGITAADLTDAPLLPEAIRRFEAWLEPYEDTRILNPLTWGGGDAEKLRKEAGRDGEMWLFGRRWIDVKTIYVAWRMAQQKNVTGGLARAMTKLGLIFQGRKHNAADDAINTFMIYRALLQQFKQAEPAAENC